jgi:hypothetical protein
LKEITIFVGNEILHPIAIKAFKAELGTWNGLPFLIDDLSGYPAGRICLKGQAGGWDHEGE